MTKQQFLLFVEQYKNVDVIRRMVIEHVFSEAELDHLKDAIENSARKKGGMPNMGAH